MHHSIDKLSFCRRICSDLTSFTKLLMNSKRLRWSKGNKDFKDAFPFTGSAYTLNIAGEKHTVYLRTYTGDIDIFYEIFYREVYGLNPSVFKNAEVIIDLGSNTGLSALYFLDKCPHAKIICAEPDPDNFAILQRNLLPFTDFSRAYLHEAAVMAEAGTVYLQKEKIKYNSNVVKNSYEKNTNAITVNGLIDIHGINSIDLIKIDIEGSEKNLFSSNTEWLTKTKYLVLEFHSDEDRQIVVSCLKDYEFDVVLLSEKGREANLLFASSRILDTK